MASNDYKHTMFADGFCLLRQILPKDSREAALRAINHSLGHAGLSPEDLSRYQATSYTPELRNERVLLDLFNTTPLLSTVESLLGSGNLLPVQRCQIALQFPLGPDTPPAPPRGHIDGLGTGVNGIPIGTYRRNFTGLAVMLLSDMTDPYMGNFTVWPGSHQRIESYMKQHGHTSLAKGDSAFNVGDIKPLQITGYAGDVILAHHLTLHDTAQNLSPFIRYAVICRFRHVDCEQFAEGAYTDMWREWEGVRQHVLVKPGT